jgi:hypothetical protein
MNRKDKLKTMNLQLENQIRSMGVDSLAGIIHFKHLLYRLQNYVFLSKILIGLFAISFAANIAFTIASWN